MKWATLVLAAVLVVGSASVSGAECAWVFWTKHQKWWFDPQVKALPTEQLEWELMSAWPTKNACEDVKARIWEVYAKECDEGKCPGIDKVEKVPHELVVHSSKGGNRSNTRTLYCIPDTIDPREKKE